MKIRIHNTKTNEPKFVYLNTSTRKMYENLSYSDSLTDIGSCTFTLIPDEQGATGEIETDIIGLEYVYLENDDNEIVWGGIIVGFSGGKDRLTVNCLDMKFALQLVAFSDDYAVSGNALDSISDLLDIALTKRDLPFIMDPFSEVVDDASLIFPKGKTIYTAIKEIVSSAYLRFIFTFERNGIDITPRLLVRSILGVTPQGVGINRGIASTETDDKVQLKYTIDSPRESNLIDFRIAYDLRAMVTKGKVLANIGGVPTVFNSAGNPLSDALAFFFGNIETSIVNFEIADGLTGQAVADNLVNNVSFLVDVTYEDSLPFELSVGDRVSLLIKTKLVRLSAGGVIDAPLTVRIEEKNVSEKDGYNIVSLKLNTNQATRSTEDIISQISKLKGDGQSTSTRVIES